MKSLNELKSIVIIITFTEDSMHDLEDNYTVTSHYKDPSITNNHDRAENVCTVSTFRCPIQSLRKVF